MLPGNNGIRKFESMKITIYHKPDCSKSCGALDIIKNRTEKIEIIDYITNPPTKAQLTELLTKLGMKPEDLVRKKEDLFKENFEGKQFNDDEWMDILINNPVLIERPVIVKGDKAIIARPPEIAEKFLSED